MRMLISLVKYLLFMCWRECEAHIACGFPYYLFVMWNLFPPFFLPSLCQDGKVAEALEKLLALEKQARLVSVPAFAHTSLCFCAPVAAL